MCGRYASFRENQDLADAFAITLFDVADWTPSWNIPPTTDVRIVVERPDEASGTQRQLRTARWGLVPSWAKDISIGARMFNARSETVAEKPSFRAAVAKRRCLVPADGYFEWQARAGAKQPFYIHPNDEVLAFAGLYEFWRPSPDAAWLVSTTILTMDSAGDLAPIHDRMPVMPTPDAWAAWLDPAITDAHAALTVLDAQRADLQITPVGKGVGRVGFDGPQVIEPVPLPAD